MVQCLSCTCAFVFLSLMFTSDTRLVYRTFLPLIQNSLLVLSSQYKVTILSTYLSLSLTTYHDFPIVVGLFFHHGNTYVSSLGLITW
jgi:hypothetical protein